MDFRLCSCGCGGALHDYELLEPALPHIIVRPTGPATTEPVGLPTAKAHLRVTEAAEDALIQQYIAAARRLVEHYCARSLAVQPYEALVGGVAGTTEPIALPWGPVRAVTLVEAVPVEGDRVPVTGWAAVGPLVSAPADGWPAAPAAVAVAYEAGEDPALVEPPLTQAILLLVGQYYDHRAPIAVGASVATLPFTVEALIQPYSQTGPGLVVL